MFLKKLILTLLATTIIFAGDMGVVNFTKCFTESKYGIEEKNQLENIKKQWTTLIENAEKELKEINEKLEDQEYLDSISPEAEDEMKTKQQALTSDLMKYQNQLYQILNQAQYLLAQKIYNYTSEAAKEIAAGKKLSVVLNKETCFYSNDKLDITDEVIKKMDKNFEQEKKTAKAEDSKKSEKK